MSDDIKNEDLVVLAGAVTIKRQVGAGMAYVDVPKGEPVGDIDDETRERLLASKAIGPRDGAAAYAAAARPVPGEVEPDEIDRDIIPGGSVEQILAWVGTDLARARVARHEELAKGLKSRAGLIAKLDEIKAAQETEPPAVPEVFTGDVAPAAAGGGVAVPDDDSAVEGKPASEVSGPVPGRRGRRS